MSRGPNLHWHAVGAVRWNSVGAVLSPYLVAALLLLALGALVCCGPKPGPTPIPIANGTCEDAEARLEELRCTEDGVDLWVGFAEACETSAKDGQDWHPDCIAGVESCSDVEAVWKGGCSR